jgi:osmotically inducible lipoprotein OsmB
MRYVKYIAVIAMFGLSACGTTPGQRAMSGGAIGAGAGTVGAILVDGNPFMGAFIGGAAGALTGAVTESEDIDFNKWWSRR